MRVPSVDELENDYAVYDEIREMPRAVSRIHRRRVSFARKFSQECSKSFRDKLATGKLTVFELRKLVEGRVLRAGAYHPKVTPTEAYATMEAEFERPSAKIEY